MWKLRRIKKGQRGFTLIELMIVTSIVGILAAVVATGVTGTTVDGRIAAKAQDVDLVQQAVDSRYQSVSEDYPYVGSRPTPTSVTTNAVTAAMIEEIDFDLLVPTYLRENPKYAAGTTGSIILASGTSYDLDGDGTNDWTIAGDITTTTDDDIVLTSSWVMDSNGKVYCVKVAKEY